MSEFSNTRAAGPLGSTRDIEQLVHDLQVRLLELQAQLEERVDLTEVLDQRIAVLQERSSRYERLFDQAPLPHCALTADGRISHCNTPLATYLGVARRELIGKLFTPFLPAGDVLAFSRHFEACIRERRRVTTELRLTSPMLGTVPFQIISTPLEEPGTCQSAFVDLTQVKRAEERLSLVAATSRQLQSSFSVLSNLATSLKALVPTMADLCVADVEVDGRVARVLFTAEDIAPERARVLGREPAAVTPLDAPLMIEAAGELELRGVMQAQAEQAAELGALGIGSLMAMPLTARGRHVGVLALAMTSASKRRYAPIDFTFAQDLAARIGGAIDSERLYADAQRGVKMRQDLLARVSHDLRSPLSGILLSADSLLQAAPPQERRGGRKHVVRIRRSVMQMRHLVEDLLDLASLERGNLSVDLHEFRVGGMLDEALETLAPLAIDHGVSLVCAKVPHLSAKCDRERVLQVLWNLVGNALRYTPEGGRVELSAEAGEGGVRVTVQDGGPGLAAPLLDHLFEREPPTRDKTRRGRGLGLYICKGIVEAMGGRIWAENAPDGGARFSFTLPRGDTAPDVEHRTVLIVDDDPSIREVVADILANHGWDVVQATNGCDALAYLDNASAPPSVMLLDLVMPVMDGRQLLHALKGRDALARIPVLLLSSAERLDDEVKRLGAAGAIRKPPDMNALLAALGAQTARAQA
jgi:PAS domain S-box-containing protein